MTLSQLMSILRARLKLIAMITMLAIFSAVVLALVVPKKFKATNTVIFNYKYADPISGASIPAQLIPGYMATEVGIISSESIAYEVIKKLALSKNPEFISDFNAATDGEDDIKKWLVEVLLKKLTVKPSRTSNLIEIIVKDKSPEFAAKVANAFSESYIKKSIELKVEPSRKAATFYTTQLADLQKKIELTNQKYTKFQRDNNLQSASGQSVDVETARLNELSSQLVVVQAQLAESRSRKQAARRGGSPDVVADAVVQMHKASLARAQADFAAVSSTYASNHPDYIAAKSQVNQARASLNRQMGTVSRSVSSSANIYAKSEAEIKSALEQQRTKVLNLNKSRNQLRLLERDLVNAQQVYDAANERYIKSNFEGESNQSNVTVLNKAVPPLKHYFPNKMIMVLLSVFLGLIIGIAYVLVTELLDRRVRSIEDMESLLDFPVFGILPKTELKQLSSEPVKSLSFKR
ncbi:MAG: chain length determinant protein EpsF [Methylophilaceae bacterium]